MHFLMQLTETATLLDALAIVSSLLILLFLMRNRRQYGSLVIDGITAGGKHDAPVPQRIFWAVMEGMIAGALLFKFGQDLHCLIPLRFCQYLTQFVLDAQ